MIKKEKIGQPEINIGLVGHVDHGKCLAIDEPILINNRLITGYELMGLAREKGILIHKKGNEESYDLKGLHTFSLDKKLNIKRTKAKLFFQKYKGELLRISTESGREISLTKNHPLLNHNLKWICAYELKKGDKIAISNFKIPNKKIEFENWKDRLREKWYFLTYNNYVRLKKITGNFIFFSKCSSKDFNDLRILLDLRYKQISKNTKLSYSLITKVLRRERKMTRNVKNKLVAFFKKINKNKFKVKKNEIIAQTEKHPTRVSCRFKDVKMDNDLVKWFSILCAEGYSRDKGVVVVQKKYPSILKEFIDISKEKFGIRFGRLSKDKKGVSRFEIYSHPFVSYLRYKFKLNTGPSRKSTIPLWVLSLNKKHQSVFLRYLFDTEAYINRKCWQISLCQVNKDNLNLLSVLLNNFNIHHRFNTQLRKKKNKEYYLTISGKDNLTKFVKYVGISDKKKELRMKNHLKRLEGKKFFTKFDNYYKNITFDKIKDIKTTDYDNYLIDLIVPKYHNFFGGYGGVLCHNTTITQRLSGRWTDTHSEELKRGITIKLGYADAIFYKCPKCKAPNCYGVSKKCAKCKSECKPLRKVSFIDAPGHETLMATMLSGAAIMDGALLLIAANETCPQPQTKEHLMALDIIGVKNIVIVQNKIDLVSEEQAMKNYEEIKNFIKGTIAENAPIVPVSAQQNVNIDVLIQAIEEHLKTQKKDLNKSPLMFVARSFDVNRPGTKVDNMIGGVLGGALKQGMLKENQKIEIKPGIKKEKEGRRIYEPITTQIVGLKTGGENVKELGPGGSIGVLTQLDPSMVKADSLTGSVVGLPGQLPPVWDKFELESHLLERVVGAKDELVVEPIKKGEALMLNVNSAATVGIVDEISKNKFHVVLKIGVCADKEDRITISRKLGDRWRLIGWGKIIK